MNCEHRTEFTFIQFPTEYGPVLCPFRGFLINRYANEIKQKLKTRGVSLHGRITAIQNLIS